MQPSVTGSTAQYAGAWPGTEVADEVTATGIKESIVLTGPSAPSSYTFDLTGAVARPDGSGGAKIVSGGKALGSVPAPSVTAAGSSDATERSSVTLSAANGSLQISIDSGWLASLPRSAFPVSIDPTYQPYGFAPASSSVHAYAKDGTLATGSVRLGANAEGPWDSAIKVPLPAPPAEQNSQPWQLGYAAMVISCPSACALSDIYAYNEASEPTSYGSVQSGGVVPAHFDGSFDQLYLFAGNSTYANGNRPWLGVRANDPSGAYVQVPYSDMHFDYIYYELPPPTKLTSPADGSVIATTTPLLKTNVTDRQICASIGSGTTCDEPYNVNYDFTISTAPHGQAGATVVDSGWLEGPYTEAQNGDFTLGTPQWRVPPGSLVDGATYYAWVAITNNLILYPSDAVDGRILITPPYIGEVSFKVKLRLGAGGPSPTDTVGSLPGSSPAPSSGMPSPGSSASSETVNMATGDLAASVGTPQMEAVGGQAGIKLHYDSIQSSTSGTAAAGGSNYGLRGEYYHDDGSHDFPASSPAGTRIDPMINFLGGYGTTPIGGIAPDWGTAGAGYMVRWVGRLSLPTTSAAVPSGTTVNIGGTTTGGMRIKFGGATVYDDWDGTSAPSGSRGFGTGAFSPGTAAAAEVDLWDPNDASVTRSKLWVNEKFPDGTHAEFLIPSAWLTTSALGLPPGWSLSSDASIWTSASDLGAQVVLHAVTGATATFTRTDDGGGYLAPPGDDDSLTSGDGTLQLSTATGYVYVFNSDGALQSVTSADDDRHPAALKYGYGPATSADGSPVVLQTITDPVSSRQIDLRYGGDGACPSANAAPDGMLCEVDFWDGTSTEILYNANQQLSEVLNPGGAATLFAYTSANQLDAIRDSLANDYITAGQPGSSACTPSTSATTCPFDTVIDYDSSGRVKSVAQPAPEPINGPPTPTRTYTYQPSTSTPGAGTTFLTIAGFDPSGNSSIPAGYASSETYDSQSRVTRKTSSDGLSSRTVWDDQDRPIIQVDASGEQTSTVYDVNSNATDTYGPAPSACFAAGSANPWPTDTSYASPPAPIEGYLPVSDPQNAAGCQTTVPHRHTTFDGGITGLGVVYWANGSFAGSPAKHGTGNGIGNDSGASCIDANSGTSNDSLCASWPAGTSPGSTDAQGNWSMKLTGDLSIPSSGTYEFDGADNQAMSLLIDGAPAGTNVVYSPTGAVQSVKATFSQQVSLDAGEHTIELDILGDSGQQTAYTLSDFKTGGSEAAAPIALSNTDPNYALATSVTDPDGKVSTTGYTASNGIDAMYDLPTVKTAGVGGPNPLPTTTSYETPGADTYLRRISTTLPDGGKTTYGYWGASQALANAICNVPAGTNEGGLLQSMTDPAPTPQDAAREQYFVYDAAGRKAARWVGPAGTALSNIPSSQWQCTTRDSRGRLLTQTWPAFGSAPARTVTYSYGVNGDPLASRVSDTAANGASISTVVDLRGRLSQYADSFSQVTVVAYDQAGQVVTVNGPNGTITKAYDPDTGNLSKVSVAGELLATAHYSGSTGQLTAVNYTNGTKATIGYDANGRKDSLVYTKASDGSLVTGDQVTDSPAGRITSELENIGGSLANPNPAGADATDYTYDAAGRLTKAYLPGSVADYGYGVSPGSDGCQQPDAGANTNRTTVTVTPHGGTPIATDSCYNDADQLTAAYARHDIALVGTSQAGQNPGLLAQNTPISLDYPSGTDDGDLALLAVTVPKGTTITTPTGYSVVGSYTTSKLLGTNATVELLRHTFTTPESSVSVAFSQKAPETAILAVYRGTDPSDPIDALSNGITNSGTSVTAPSVTTTLPNDRLVVFDGAAGSSASTWTAPPGTDLRSSAASGGSVTSISADATQADAGPTPAETSTASATGALVSVLVALKPEVDTSTSAYDAHGNQTKDGDTTYTYDASDRLASTTIDATTTTYTYDAVGRLVVRSSGGTATTYGYGAFNSAPIDTRSGAVIEQLVSLPGGVTDTIQTAGAYRPVTASRILDTATGTGVAQGKVAAHGTVELQVAGVAGVATANLSAVAINLAAVDPATSGQLVAYADGTAQTGTPNVSFAAGQTVGNLAIVPVGADGKIAVYNDSSGSTDLLGDVEGFYESGTALNAGSFVPVDAAPVLDTASGTGVPQGAAAPGSTTDLTISGVGGVPTSNVSAVVMTVTASSSTSPGTITVYPDGSSRPATSNLDYSSGQAIANTVIVPVDSTGQVDFYNDSTGSAQLAAYIVGYYRSGPSGSNSGSYHPLAPTQILDTSSGTGAPQGAVAADGSLGLQVDGVAGVPSSCVSAVALNLTASSGTSSGSLVAYPAGSAEPDTANLDYASGQPIAGLAIVAVSAGGKVDIANRSSGTVQIAADVVGYTECDAGADHDDLWSYADLHGNTTATADDAGDRVGQVINYDPWGTPMANPVSAGNAAVTANFTSFGADAKITDPDSGITIMGARAYNPAEARFTSVDPMQGGCANGYVYSFGDPYTQPDLTGNNCGNILKASGLLAGTAATGIGAAILMAPEESVALETAGLFLGIYAAGADLVGCVHDRDAAACVGAGIGIAAAGSGIGSIIAAAHSSTIKSLYDALGANLGLGGFVSDFVTSAESVGCGIKNLFT